MTRGHNDATSWREYIEHLQPSQQIFIKRDKNGQFWIRTEDETGYTCLGTGNTLEGAWLNEFDTD